MDRNFRVWSAVAWHHFGILDKSHAVYIKVVSGHPIPKASIRCPSVQKRRSLC